MTNPQNHKNSNKEIIINERHDMLRENLKNTEHYVLLKCLT